MVNSVCSSCSAQTRSAELLAQRLEEKKAETAETADLEREEALKQAAKEAAAETREAKADLPDRVQEKVASGIARGADAQSVFEALVTSQAEDGSGA